MHSGNMIWSCLKCFLSGCCQDVESYIHRSGRTGRAGRTGVCICFYQRKEEDQLRYVENKAVGYFLQITWQDHFALVKRVKFSFSTLQYVNAVLTFTWRWISKPVVNTVFVIISGNHIQASWCSNFQWYHQVIKHWSDSDFFIVTLKQTSTGCHRLKRFKLHFFSFFYRSLLTGWLYVLV